MFHSIFVDIVPEFFVSHLVSQKPSDLFLISLLIYIDLLTYNLSLTTYIQTDSSKNGYQTDRRPPLFGAGLLTKELRKSVSDFKIPSN